MNADLPPTGDDTAREFVGDACIVLPRDYLQSADAAAELYEEELTRLVENLDIEGLRPSPFRHAGLQSLLVALGCLVCV